MLPSPFALQTRLSEFPAAAARLAVRRQGMDSCAQGSVAPRATNGLQIGQELRQSFQVGLEGRAPLRAQPVGALRFPVFEPPVANDGTDLLQFTCLDAQVSVGCLQPGAQF